MKTIVFSSLFAPSPTINLPHAHPTKSHFQLGSGAAFLRSGPLPSARFAGELNTRKLGIKFSTTSYFGAADERFGVAGVRYMVLNKDRIRLAPFAYVAQHTGFSPLDERYTGRLGLAIDTGGDRWRYDGSISLYGMQFFPYESVETPLQTMTVFETVLLGSEHGVSYKLNERHGLRFGLMGALPSIRHHWSIRKGPQLSTTIATLGNQNLLQLELGMGF